MLEILDRCPDLAHLIFDDPRGLRNYSEPGLVSLDQLIESGQALARSQPALFKAEVDKVKPDDVAAMFFTSGTTLARPNSRCRPWRSSSLRATSARRFSLKSSWKKRPR
jgi:acyl-coenzyme A synthetase/AMP-(fatty) acid ligase